MPVNQYELCAVNKKIVWILAILLRCFLHREF